MKRPLLVLLVVFSLTSLYIVSDSQFARAEVSPNLNNQWSHHETGVIATVKVPRLNVRRLPLTEGSVRGVLALNSAVPLIGRTIVADWVEADTVFGRGWLDARFISTNISILTLPVTEGQIPPYAKITTAPSATVRRGPFNEYPVVGIFPIGAEFDVIGLHSSNSHVQVVTPRGIGWISLQVVTVQGTIAGLPVTDRLVPPLAVVNAYRVRVRTQPDLNAPVIGLVRLAKVYDIIGTIPDQSWVQISSPFGPGWVEANLVRVVGFLPRADEGH